MAAEQKKEENFWTKDLLEMPTAKFRDWIDNKFQGDQRTLDQIIEERRKLRNKGIEQRKEQFAEISKTTPSKITRGLISGPIKAINETVEFGDDIYDYFAGNPYDNNDLIDLKGIGLEVKGDKEDWTYTIPQAVTQFLLPMGLASGATRNVITNPWARGAVAGFITDAVVQDPYEENLFNMLDKHPRFASPVTEILKAKTPEEIGVAEARLRQATGGTLTGEVATGVVLGVRALKKAPKEVQERILKRLMNDENTRLVYAASDDIDNLGDEIIPEFDKLSNKSRQVLEAIQSGKEADVSKEEILESIQEIGQKYPEKLTPKLRKYLGIDSKPTGRQKILPGTPHPTDAKKVRGYDGRWVTKKHFDQVTESRKGANEIRAQFDQPVDAGGGGAVPPRKPPSGSGADVPPVDPTDPKVQTTFNPKFLPDLDVEKLILDEAEKVKNLDASGQWPYRRTFKDMVNNANQLLPKEVIEQARLFNARYGRGGESDLPATLIAMNQQMNKNATALYDLSKAMDMALSTGNKEGFAELKEQLIRETKVLDGLITLNKPLKTVPAQTLAANKAGGGIADKVATVEDLASRTPAEKAIDQAVDVRGVVDEGGEEVVEQETIRQIIEAAEKGDKPAMKKLRTITKRLQAASGNPEALRRMAKEAWPLKGVRISNEIFINSILSGPETHAVNILSTALNTVARPIELIVGSGNTQQAMRGAKELIYLTQSISDSLKMAKAAFRIEDNIINPGAMVQDASRFNVRMDGEGLLPNFINTLGTIQRLPSRFLLAEDEFFKSMNFRAYVKASAWENGVNKGLDGKQLKAYIQDQFDKTIGIVNEGSMKNTKSIQIAELYEKAQQYAAETTFTADLPQGSFGAGLQKFASHPVGRIVFPFVRTPLNIFKAQVRRTPVVNLWLQEYRQALRSSDPSVAARARGEMVVGGAVWSVAGIAAYAINDDFSELALTGGGPSDYDLLNQKKATGWQPYSFRFLLKDENGQVIMGKDGKPRYKYVSFKRLDPWSSFLMMAADSAAITGQISQQDRDDFGIAAAVALGRNITNKTYLQGVVEISDLLQKPHKLESWLARRAAAGGFIGFGIPGNPFSSLGRSASKALDPTIMDKRVRSGYEGIVVLRKFHNEFAATIPGYGAGMRPIRNFITGSLVEYPPGYGPDIMNIMNPIKETNSVNHAVLTTLVDIGAKIPQPSDNLPFGKKLDGTQELSGVKLNKDQYADYVEEIAFAKINGVPLVRALYNQMQQPEIKALLVVARGANIKTDNQDTAVAAQEVARAQLEEKFKDTISKYKKAGRSLFLEKNPDLALDYAKRKAEIMQIMNESALDSFKELQGVSN